MVSADKFLICKNRHHRSGSRAAGQGEILHASLICEDGYVIVVYHIIEIDICAFWKNLMMAQSLSQFSQFFLVLDHQSRNLQHYMRYSRISQFHVCTADTAAARLRFSFFHRSHIVEPYPVKAVRLSITFYHARDSFYVLNLSRKAVLITISGDAPGPVSAHLSETSVCIIEFHLIIAAIFGRIYHHKAVGSDGESPVANFFGQVSQLLIGNLFFYVVHDDKIVSGSVHLYKIHIKPLSLIFIYIRGNRRPQGL